METTTEFFAALLETTSNTFSSAAAYSPLLTAADILSDANTAAGSNKLGDSDISEQQDTPQITFEIPSHRDLEHIQHLDTFNTLLKRLGKTVYNSGIAAAPLDSGHAVALSADGHTITNEQISNSVVLNLADLKHSAASGLERFFQGADMHSIINYLWIGVVTSLVILSVIFILFSCYFYRKFREWKKCNKDIRAHLNNNDMYPSGAHNNASCDTLLPYSQSAEAAYYQKETPPCYTIATGLPTYDEALHHQHFSYGMKFMYPNLAAVHHHATISGNIAANNWEKHDLTKGQLNQQQHLLLAQQPQHHHQQQPQHKLTKTATLLPAAPPAYDATEAAAASVALLSQQPASVSIDLSACGTETVEALPVPTTAITTNSTAVSSSAKDVVVIVA